VVQRQAASAPAHASERCLKPARRRPTIVTMDPIAATSGVTANVPATARPKAVDRTRAFEEKLKAAGAKLEKVHGHAYEKVSGGKHDGKLLNTSGNERSGRLFELVHRHGRTYHVYGSGNHRLFVGMPQTGSGGKAAPSA
jgi:hypothetical protein